MAVELRDVELFSRLYISCQTCDGNLKHKNRARPPSLPVSGRLCLIQKVIFWYDSSEAQSEVSSVVIDGAAIVQMLKPETLK